MKKDAYCGIPIDSAPSADTYRAINLPPIRTLGQLETLANLLEGGALIINGAHLSCTKAEAKKIPAALRKRLGKHLRILP